MPPVTQALIIVNVAVYLLQSMGGGAILGWFALWPPGAGPSYGPDFQVWQLVTYGFLHGNLAHIFFNMFALYMFGSDIERLFGSRFYLVYYFASVVSAALTHLVVNSLMGAPPYPMVGASGGVYGLLLAFGLYFPRRRGSSRPPARTAARAPDACPDARRAKWSARPARRRVPARRGRDPLRREAGPRG